MELNKKSPMTVSSSSIMASISAVTRGLSTRARLSLALFSTSSTAWVITWRVRSQKALFYKVWVMDSTSLHRFTVILDEGQHLRGYVYEVMLMGYHLHTTASVFAMFPTYFGKRLPNLEQIYVIHMYEGQVTWLPSTLAPPNTSSFPYIPLHPRFPAFLSSFKAVLNLSFYHTTFHSFVEFIRILI